MKTTFVSAAMATVFTCVLPAAAQLTWNSGTTRTSMFWNIPGDGSNNLSDSSSYSPFASLPQNLSEAHLYQTPGTMTNLVRSQVFAESTFRADGINGSQGFNFEYDLTNANGSIGTQGRTTASFTLTSAMNYNASIFLLSGQTAGNTLTVTDSTNTTTFIQISTFSGGADSGTLGPGTYSLTVFSNTGVSLNFQTGVNQVSKTAEWDLTFTEVPAPATLGLLACTGLVAIRRRRAS